MLRLFRTGYTIALIGVCSVVGVKAQSPGALYCITNPGPGVFEFAEFQLAGGAVTVLQTLPIGSISSAASACIDGDHGWYHFCTGSTLYSYDANNVATPVTTVLPVSPTADFTAIEFDPCDSVFIGIMYDPPGSIDIVRFDPIANQFSTVLPLFPTTYLPGGVQAAFDPVLRRYLVQTTTGFIGVDVDAGTFVFNTPITVPVGLSGFGHLAYDCTTQRLVGTAVGTGSEGGYGKFLCELDPVTGLVTELTASPSPDGIWKPMLGSSTIDLGTGLFHWSGAGGVVVGAQVVSGSMSYDQTSTSGELNLIEHFSTCACSISTGVQEALRPMLSVYPVPATDALIVEGTSVGSFLLILRADGSVARSVLSQGDTVRIPLAGLSAGVYFLRVDDRAIRFVVE